MCATSISDNGTHLDIEPRPERGLARAHSLLRHGQQTFALHLLLYKLAMAANGFCFFANTAL